MATEKKSAPAKEKKVINKMATDDLLKKAKAGDKVAGVILIARDVKKLAQSQAPKTYPVKGEEGGDNFQSAFARIANYSKGAVNEGVKDAEFIKKAKAAQSALASGGNDAQKWAASKGFMEALMELRKERGGFTRKPLSSDEIKSFSL